MGGRVGGAVHVAGGTYGPVDFWPGPLGSDAALPSDGCAPFDRIWAVSQLDLWNFATSGAATPDLAEWPVGLGAPTVDAGGQPVVTSDRSRVIDLGGGERPVVSGRQTAFWILNDVGNVHVGTGSAPLGIEAQVLAVVPDGPVLAAATVYRYRFVNRSSAPITDFRAMLFADIDLGSSVDDYVGSDSTRQMVIGYNARTVDADYGVPPAMGIDVLSGAEGAPIISGTGGEGLFPPRTAAEFYCTMQSLRRDCSPMREGQDGAGADGPATRWGFPGDPVTGAFWSMENIDGAGTRARLFDQSAAIATGAATLAPGAATDLTFTILLAQGSDRLDSVVRLRSLSDAAQTAFDSGALLSPGAPVSPSSVSAPALVSPSDGEAVLNGPVTLTWQAVPGADRYRVEIATDPAFADATTREARGTSIPGVRGPVDGTAHAFYWRVRAYGPDAVGPFSPGRSYQNGADYTAIEFVGHGAGIVETARPGGGVCAGTPGDVGCALYGGNTVWRDGDVSGDYYVSGTVPDFITIASEGIGALYPGGAVEMRFTAAGGLAVYPSRNGFIAHVPFEAWYLGDDPGPGDDVRMIPFITPNGNPPQPIADWADSFPTGEQYSIIPSHPLPATFPVRLMQPKPGGSYAAFEADAVGFGGPGAVYDPAADRDTEVGLDPTTGAACANQGYYADFCYRNDRLQEPGQAFVSPVGNVVFIDLAEDGTTPPAGTTVLFQVSAPRFVDAAATPPDALAGLGQPYPNPSRSMVRIPFETPAGGRVRLAVVDLLGRTVAVLVDGDVAAGAHEASVPDAFAPGVYVVVLDVAGAPRQTRRLTVVR